MRRDTSAQAYYTLKDLGERQQEVYLVIKRKVFACNIDIAEELHLPINSVTPRTNELVRMGIVEEGKKSIGPTGRVVTFWKIKRNEDLIDWEAMRQETIKLRDQIIRSSGPQSSLF